MLQGLATSNFQAADLAAARAWYTELLGLEPYFVRDGYLEWRLGRDGDEFGVVDARFVPGSADRTPGGQYVYWAVEDVDAAVARLVARGATVHEPPTPRGEGFTTAAVVDPFGNVLGVMTNPHWAGTAG
ncbi:VOC family protein [Cellulomonas pakistanensis]|uniref:Glyoxalase n=1 Tax=Cellulomonas pakistanensis TaxID=992287 RepID=A0A919PBP0_9CELL|nr:VOC family protein [Cellulomonas pakistanensis]GIG37581.1 glyoxalase [Cellulomonas pakistanensis]